MKIAILGLGEAGRPITTDLIVVPRTTTAALEQLRALSELPGESLADLE
jgi:hypothetical protein